MIRLYLYILLGLFLSSCDNLEDYYSTINEKPVIEFTGIPSAPATKISDSLKLGFNYSIHYQIKDEEKLSLDIPVNDNFQMTAQDGLLSIQGIKESKNNILLTATDSYKKTGEAEIDMTVFNNLPPVALLTYQITEFDGSYFITLDGFQSIDRDAKFGGNVAAYEFIINDYNKISKSPQLKYSVNKDAFYTIKFRVKDNNNEWSNQIILYIKI